MVRSMVGVLIGLAACGSVENAAVDGAAVDALAVDGGSDGSPGDGPGCVPSPAGSAARWRADQDTTDSAGDHDGVAAGGTGYGSGRHGSAFIFDGVDDHVTIDDGDVLWPASSFSIEAWVKTTTTSLGLVVSKYQCAGICDPGTRSAYWAVYVNAAGAPVFDYRSDATKTITSLTATQLDVADGAWHHLVAVRDVDARQTQLFVDSAVANSRAIAGVELGVLTNLDGETDPVVIGAGSEGGLAGFAGFLPGAVDDVAYYDVALSAAEIAAIHAAPDGICP